MLLHEQDDTQLISLVIVALGAAVILRIANNKKHLERIEQSKLRYRKPTDPRGMAEYQKRMLSVRGNPESCLPDKQKVIDGFAMDSIRLTKALRKRLTSG